MPKVVGTRKQKAAELKEMLQRGPAFTNLQGGEYTTEEARQTFLQWSNTWIIPLVNELVPELRK